MSSNVQHDNAWPVCVSTASANHVTKEEDTDIEEGRKVHAVHGDASLTERDYIGLSATSLAAASTAQASLHSLMHLNADSIARKSFDARDEEPQIRDTELRLGIGPYHGDVSALHTSQHRGHVAQSMPHQPLHVQNQILRQSENGLNMQYRRCEDAVAYNSMEYHQSFWPWGPGVAPGRLMIPVPKVSTIPAKRPYMEATGENNNNKASICTLSTNTNTQMGSTQAISNHVSSASAPPLLPTLSQGRAGLYAWSGNTGTPPSLSGAGWQPTNLDQNGIVVSGTYAKNTCADRSLPSPSLFKPPPPSPVSQYSPLPSMTSTSTLATHSSAPVEKPLLTPDTQKEDARVTKAPVVGWPPVRRSFRKNTQQSSVALGANKESGAPLDRQEHEDAAKSSESAGEQNKSSVKDALFVKAKLDGVRICRKVDLTSYSSYDSLKSALQEMFQGYVCNDNAKLDLLHGKNYVLTHEDKDGDWMLVGDVPWHMFVTTVKSFRIIKAADAVGLGEKGFAKFKAQDMNCKA
eukprot:c23742_g1_i2 orf=701-2260(+)